MATNSLQSSSLHHTNPSLSFSKRHSETALSSLLFPISSSTTAPLSHSLSSPSAAAGTTAAFSLTPTTSSSVSTSPDTSFGQLETHLAAGNFRRADEETRRLLIVLAGEAAQKRGYVYFSEVQFISESDLKAIDGLWRKHSDGRFGYGVQRRIFEKVKRDFTKLFLKVGWMKKLDTEVEQYNYRSFPGDFRWELDESTPEGHLPLTNALRGIQLLNSILCHPAFEEFGGGEAGDEEEGGENGGVVASRDDGMKSVGKSVFKPDYSF